MPLGLAPFHNVGPIYDPVFLATGAAVAAFGLARGATLLTTAGGLLRAAGRVPPVAALLAGLRFLGAAGTSGVGVLLATGVYEGFATVQGPHR